MTAGGRVPVPGGRLVPAAAAGALLVRPDLWPTAARLAVAMIPGAGRWPRWPAVRDAYGRFRHQTMFGADGAAELSGRQLVDYVAWCRMMGAVGRSAKRSRRVMGRGRVSVVLSAPHSRRR